MNLRSLARCPTSVQLIHGALYGLAFETCSKTHFKVLLRSLRGLPKCALHDRSKRFIKKEIFLKSMIENLLQVRRILHTFTDYSCQIKISCQKGKIGCDDSIRAIPSVSNTLGPL